MVKTTPWNWNNVESPFWKVPSEDVYYFLHHWKQNGLTKILDLGCGIGRHSILFANHGFSVTGFDLSKNGLEMLSKQSKEFNLHIKTVHGDIIAIPFNNDQFDSILAYHSVYHVDSSSMIKVINDMARILCNNGEVYLSMLSKTTYSFTAPECEVVDDNVRLKQEEEGSILPHFFVDYKDIVALFSNKFNLLKVRHVEDIFDGKSSWHYFIHAQKK